MNLGIGLGIGTARGGGAPAFDLASLYLTGWFEDYDVGAASGDWAGKASAGTSGSRTMATGTAPTQGTALNGHGTAAFTTASSLVGGAMSLYLTAAAWSAWWLQSVTTAPCVPLSAADFSWFFGAITNSGVQAQVTQAGGGPSASPAMTLGVYYLAQADYDGTTVRVRVNGGTWATSARANIASLVPNMTMGLSASTGTIASVGTLASKISDGTHDSILARMRTWSGLALT